MNTNSFIFQVTLPCIMINAGGHSELPDESLSAREYHDLQHLLAPGGAITLGEPPSPVKVSWGEKPGWPTQFDIYLGEDPLLVAGLATDAREATRLRGWFNLLQGATSGCLQQSQQMTWPRVHPWLGILLMPGALQLCDAHLDALCGLGRALGQVWLRLSSSWLVRGEIIMNSWGAQGRSWLGRRDLKGQQLMPLLRISLVLRWSKALIPSSSRPGCS